MRHWKPQGTVPSPIGSSYLWHSRDLDPGRALEGERGHPHPNLETDMVGDCVLTCRSYALLEESGHRVKDMWDEEQTTQHLGR